eukprot:gene35018-45328_t
MTFRPVTLAVSNYFLGTQAKNTITCSVPSVVQEMSSFLLSAATSPGAAILRYCNGYNWTAYSCTRTSMPSMCVGCITNPCASTSFNSVVRIDPCEMNPNRASISVLRVAYSYRQPPPSIQELTTAPTNSSVLIIGKLSSFSEMYCAVFTNEQLSALNPSSLTEAIIFQNNFASSNSQNIVRILVSGLEASTSYKTFCMTALFGATLSMSAVRNKSTTFNTACCKSVLVEQSISTVVYGQTVVSFLSFKIDSFPSSSILLSVDIDASSSLHSRSINGSFFPSQILLEASYSSYERGDVLRTMSLSNILPLGCYLYHIMVSGPSASEYVVIRGSQT